MESENNFDSDTSESWSLIDLNCERSSDMNLTDEIGAEALETRLEEVENAENFSALPGGQVENGAPESTIAAGDDGNIDPGNSHLKNRPDFQVLFEGPKFEDEADVELYPGFDYGKLSSGVGEKIVPGTKDLEDDSDGISVISESEFNEGKVNAYESDEISDEKPSDSDANENPGSDNWKNGKIFRISFGESSEEGLNSGLVPNEIPNLKSPLVEKNENGMQRKYPVAPPVYRPNRNNRPGFLMRLTMGILLSGMSYLILGYFCGDDESLRTANNMAQTVRKLQKENLILHSRLTQLNRAVLARGVNKLDLKEEAEPACLKDEFDCRKINLKHYERKVDEGNQNLDNPRNKKSLDFSIPLNHPKNVLAFKQILSENEAALARKSDESFEPFNFSKYMEALVSGHYTVGTPPPAVDADEEDTESVVLEDEDESESELNNEEPVEKHEEPSGKIEELGEYHEDPIIKYEGPSEKFEDLAKYHEDPIIKYEEPSDKFEDLAKYHEDPIIKYEEPSDKFEDLAKDHEDPIIKYEEPSDKFEDLIQYHEDPIIKYQELSEKFEDLGVKLEEPVEKLEEPSENYEEPSKKHEHEHEDESYQINDSSLDEDDEIRKENCLAIGEKDLSQFRWFILKDKPNCSGIKVEDLEELESECLYRIPMEKICSAKNTDEAEDLYAATAKTDFLDEEDDELKATPGEWVATLRFHAKTTHDRDKGKKPTEKDFRLKKVKRRLNIGDPKRYFDFGEKWAKKKGKTERKMEEDDTDGGDKLLEYFAKAEKEIKENKERMEECFMGKDESCDLKFKEPDENERSQNAYMYRKMNLERYLKSDGELKFYMKDQSGKGKKGKNDLRFKKWKTCNIKQDLKCGNGSKCDDDSADWFSKWAEGREKCRRDQKISEWQFDRAKSREYSRMGDAFWQFTRAYGRQNRRMHPFSRKKKAKYYFGKGPGHKPDSLM